MQALEECDLKNSDDVDEVYIEIEDEELKLDQEQAQMMENPTQEFMTVCTVQNDSSWRKESISRWNATLLRRIMVEKLVEALKVELDAANEGVKTPLCN